MFTISLLGITIGAACTLTDIREKLLSVISNKEWKSTQPLSSIVEMLYWFAGDQVRNVAVSISDFLIWAVHRFFFWKTVLTVALKLFYTPHELQLNLPTQLV